MDQLLDELGGGDFKFGSGVAMPVDGQLDLSALGADPTGGMGAYGDLLSLPMFKMESLGFGEVDNGPRYLLLAQTSPLTKMSDVSVTYLNKGQVYELTLEALGNCQSYRSGLIRTTIRVSFFIMSEIIMRNQEQDQWEAWCSEHPGERIIEIESGFMVENVSHDLLQPNCATFDWHASKGASVMFKLNCLSSEFSAKRHGGEKGALLRLEIDAYYQHTVNDCFDLFHCANCHIKVFKEKGADRKNKVEMQKFTGLSEEDKAGLRAPFSMSVFQDFCVDATSAQKQLPPGVTTLDTTTFIAGPYSVGSMTSPPSSVSTTGSAAAATTPGSVGGAAGGGDLAVATPAMATPGAVSNSVDSGTESIADVLSCVLAQAQPSPLATSLSFEPEPLRVDSTVEQTQEWLKGNGFGMHLQTLANFSGVDLLKLQRADMKEILGEAEGIRLNNAMQTRSVRPLQVFYIVQEEDQYYRGVYLYQCSVVELRSALSRHCGLMPAQIASIQWLTSSGVQVVVDHEMLMNLQPESTFRLEKKLRCTDPTSGLEEYEINLFSTT